MRQIRFAAVLPRTLLWLAAKANGLQIEHPDFWSKGSLRVCLLSENTPALEVFVNCLLIEALTKVPEPTAPVETFAYHPHAMDALRIRAGMRPMDSE